MVRYHEVRFWVYSMERNTSDSSLRYSEETETHNTHRINSMLLGELLHSAIPCGGDLVTVCFQERLQIQAKPQLVCPSLSLSLSPSTYRNLHLTLSSFSLPVMSLACSSPSSLSLSHYPLFLSSPHLPILWLCGYLRGGDSVYHVPECVCVCVDACLRTCTHVCVCTGWKTNMKPL